MTIGRLWAGNIYGTNPGNVFLIMEGEDAALSGTLRVNEPGVGLYEYSITGSFDGSRLTLAGKPQTRIEGTEFGRLKVTATLGANGNLEGEWETSIGSAGTFNLYPHDRPRVSGSVDRTPTQLYTARQQFGAIEIDREQIVALAEDIQEEFKVGQVVITVVAGTEQSGFLADFKELKINADKAEAVKIFVQELEDGGTNKGIVVEIGPQFSGAMTQGGDEAWVLGRLQKLKTDLQRFVRAYPTNFSLFGFDLGPLMVVAAIVYLPSLTNFRERAIFMVGIFALILAINRLKGRYLPNAAIYLGKKPVGPSARIAPYAISWLIAVTAGIMAILLGANLQKWLALLTAP